MDNFVVRKNQKPQASLPVINVYTDGEVDGYTTHLADQL